MLEEHCSRFILNEIQELIVADGIISLYEYAREDWLKTRHECTGAKPWCQRDTPTTRAGCTKLEQDPSNQADVESASLDIFSKQIEIDIREIDLSQNYRTIDILSDEFLALKESIQLQGLMQPPVVTLQQKQDQPFLCVAGHRRIIALRELNVGSVRCIVLNVKDPTQIHAARLAENIVRENLKPLELAHAVKNLKIQLNVSSKGLARLLNKDRAYLSRILRIADWPDDVKELVRVHHIGMRRLFLIAARNLADDALRKEIQALIEGKAAAPASSPAKYKNVRENYFKSQNIPNTAQDWILKFLRDNKIRGWFEDTLTEAGTDAER